MPALEKTTDGNNHEHESDRAGTIIEVRNLTKRFGHKLVLDNINLSIEKGKTTVVIGPSGCGKTVLIKHFIVLQRPSEGEVYFKGRRVDHLSERELNQVRTHFGYLFQEGALFDSMTVAENIMFPIRQHAKIRDWRQVDEAVKMKLAMVGLDGFQNYFPARLSGGQRKRAALARAIALNPEVILYDEPTTGLDPIRSDIINELILKLERELGVTSVVVTHDMKSAYKVANRIIMLHNGRVDRRRRCRSHPQSPPSGGPAVYQRPGRRGRPGGAADDRIGRLITIPAEGLRVVTHGESHPRLPPIWRSSSEGMSSPTSFTASPTARMRAATASCRGVSWRRWMSRISWRWCGTRAEQGLPVAPRGAGSGVAGESLCSGIVLDMTRYLKRDYPD